MAKVTKTKAEITYTLELSERATQALAQLLIVANFDKGEGPLLEEIYDALTDAGVEDWSLYNTIEDGEVTVERDDR